MNVARSVTKLFSAQIANRAVSFIAIVLLARYIGGRNLGIFFLFQASLGLLAIFSNIGLRKAVEKRVSGSQDDDDIMKTGMVLKFFPMAAISVLLIVFSPQVNGYIGGDVALILIITLFVHEYYKLGLNIFHGELRVGETAIIRLSEKFIFFIVSLYLAVDGFGYLAPVYGLLTGQFIGALWLYYAVNIPLGEFSLDRARSLFDYSKYQFLSSLDGYFHTWLDILLIGFFLTQVEVGAYEVAWKIASVCILFTKSAGLTVFPQISKWNSAGEIVKIENVIENMLILSLATVLPAFFGSVLIGQEILNMVFGQEFGVAWLALIILMFGNLIQAPHVLVNESLEAINRPDLTAQVAIVTLIMNIVLNIPLILTIGIAGAAVATLLARLIGLLLKALYLRKYLAIRVNIYEVNYILMASVAMFLVLYLLKSGTARLSFSGIIFMISLGVLVYVSLLLSSHRLRKKVIRILGSIQ